MSHPPPVGPHWPQDEVHARSLPYKIPFVVAPDHLSKSICHVP